MAQVKTPTSNLFAVLQTENRREREEKKKTPTSGTASSKTDVVLTPKQRAELKAKADEEKLQKKKADDEARAENERRRIEFEEHHSEGFSEPRYLARKTKQVEVRTQTKGPNNNYYRNKGENRKSNNNNNSKGGNNNFQAANNNNNFQGGNNNYKGNNSNKGNNNNNNNSNKGPGPIKNSEGWVENKNAGSGGQANRQAPRQNKGNTDTRRNNSNDKHSQGKTPNKALPKKGGLGPSNWGDQTGKSDESAASWTSDVQAKPSVAVVSTAPEGETEWGDETGADVDKGNAVDSEEEGDASSKPTTPDLSYDDFLALREAQKKELDELVGGKGARLLTDEEKQSVSKFTQHQSKKDSNTVKVAATSAVDNSAAILSATGTRKGTTAFDAGELQFRVAGPRPSRGGRGRGRGGDRDDNRERNNDNRNAGNNENRNETNEGERKGARGGRGGRGRSGDGRGNTKIPVSQKSFPALGK